LLRKVWGWRLFRYLKVVEAINKIINFWRINRWKAWMFLLLSLWIKFIFFLRHLSLAIIIWVFRISSWWLNTSFQRF
jgi:hypothetical protein